MSWPPSPPRKHPTWTSRDADLRRRDQRRELARLAHDHVRAPARGRARASAAARSARTRPAKTSLKHDPVLLGGRRGLHARPQLGHRGLVGIVERARGAARRGATWCAAEAGRERTSCPAATQAWAKGISGPMCPAPRVEAKRMRMCLQKGRPPPRPYSGDPRAGVRPYRQRGERLGLSAAAGRRAVHPARARRARGRPARRLRARLARARDQPPADDLRPAAARARPRARPRPGDLVRVQGHRALPGRGRRALRGLDVPRPLAGLRDAARPVAFYPGRVDAAWLDDERVLAQEGDFYGGWITADLAGPFKGARGTLGW